MVQFIIYSRQQILFIYSSKWFTWNCHCLSIHLSIPVAIHPSIHPSSILNPSIHSSIYPSLNPPILPSTHPFIHSSILPSTHPSIRLIPPFIPCIQQSQATITHLSSQIEQERAEHEEHLHELTLAISTQKHEYMLQIERMKDVSTQRCTQLAQEIWILKAELGKY